MDATATHQPPTIIEPITSTARRHFTVAEYERMIEAGILTEDEQVELLDGEIYCMSPIGARHVHVVMVLTDLLVKQIGDVAFVGVQNPIRLGDASLPQPDIAVMHRRNYMTGLPGAADVLCVIEVAESSRDQDRSSKLPRYAAAGIAEAWLVDLPAGIIERHSEPRDGIYRQITIARAGDTLSSTILTNLTIAVDVVLGAGETP